jgi:crotonobetainyl-CoA:carnitine CoA-transferase CaiB-like acyl-CoA transferase
MAGGPLEGIRIVDLTQAVVGPLATQILADHGADVIKVESKEGDLIRFLAGKSVTPGMGPKFLHLNRNKRSIVLDLKQESGYAALVKLIASADVFMWNIRPAAIARLKLTYEDVQRVNPKIIYCGMFGFGQKGRYRANPAYDNAIQGIAGLAALNHRATGEPRYMPMVIADKVVGLTVVQMIAMALYRRSQTGEGCSIQIPMFENIAKFVLEDHMYLRTFDPPLGGTGDQRLLDPLGKPVPTKDGWICLSANTNKQVFALFDAIGAPELKNDPRFGTVSQRFANVQEYFRLRNEKLTAKTTAEWLHIFERVGVPAMPYNTLEEVLDDPHLRDVGFFETREHPTEGRIINMRLPNEWSCGARRDWQGAPRIGEQSIEILREAGLTPSEIDDMLRSQVTIDGSQPT